MNIKINITGRYLLTVAFILGSMVFTSCNDFLETTSKSALQDNEIYSTASNVDKALVGVYGTLKPFSTYYFVMSEARSDNMFEITEAKSNDYADCAQFNTTGLVSDNIVANCWADHYTLIAAANALIEKLDMAKDLKSETMVQYEAEARFLRALSYFDLVRFYGRVPVSTTVLTADEAFKLPQSEAIDVYNNAIIPDLEYAIENLADVAVDYNGVKHTERATKIAAKALLGKVYMQMAGYPLKQNTLSKARNLFKEVLDAWDWNHKWAATAEQWNTMWLHENDNKFFIFEIQYIAEKNQGNPAAPLARPSNTSADNYCGANLTAGQHIYAERQLQLEMVQINTETGNIDFTDKRFFNTINMASWYDEETGTYQGGLKPTSNQFVTKFLEHKMKRDSLGYSNMDATIIDRTYWPQNWPVLRIEDVMLLYAECAGISDGLEYLNKIRVRAGYEPLPSSISDDRFQNEVRLERRKELLGEGHRWFDEVRQNTFVSDIRNMMIYYMTYCDAAHSSAYQAYANRVTQNSALYPIPLSQMRVCAGLYKQNPGYN